MTAVIFARSYSKTGTPWSALGCREPTTQSSKKQILFKTLQSVQSVELFDFNREPTARERQRTPRSDKERLELFNLNRAPRARENRERQGAPENALERLGL